jgi:hypothetical protein
VTPVFDISFTSPASTLAAAAKDARDNGDVVSLVYDTVPLALLIAGALFLVLGVAGFAVARRRPHTPAGPTDALAPAEARAERDVTPVG